MKEKTLFQNEKRGLEPATCLNYFRKTIYLFMHLSLANVYECFLLCAACVQKVKIV